MKAIALQKKAGEEFSVTPKAFAPLLALCYNPKTDDTSNSSPMRMKMVGYVAQEPRKPVNQETGETGPIRSPTHPIYWFTGLPVSRSTNSIFIAGATRGGAPIPMKMRTQMT